MKKCPAFGGLAPNSLLGALPLDPGGSFAQTPLSPPTKLDPSVSVTYLETINVETAQYFR